MLSGVMILLVKENPDAVTLLLRPFAVCGNWLVDTVCF